MSGRIQADRLYTFREAARLGGVSFSILHRRRRCGVVKAEERSWGARRYYLIRGSEVLKVIPAGKGRKKKT